MLAEEMFAEEIEYWQLFFSFNALFLLIVFLPHFPVI